MDIKVSIFMDVMRQYPGIDAKCLAEIALYRQQGCSSQELETFMIQTAAERNELAIPTGNHFVIAKMHGYRPSFAAQPITHRYEHLARVEQQRLAANHREAFGLYQLRGIYKNEF